MDKILEYISNYGWSILIIAVAVILFIGILKACKVFNKIESKNIKKTIYFALNVALSFAGSAIYFAIFHKSFDAYVGYSFAQVATTTTLYSIYEYAHIRTFIQYLIKIVASWIKKNPDSKLAKDLKKLGLGAEQIEEIQNAVSGKVAENAQKAEEAKKIQEAESAKKAKEAVQATVSQVSQANAVSANQNPQIKF